MSNELYLLLQQALEREASIDVPISKLQHLAGEDWLLELCTQAQKLNAIAEPHPQNLLYARITRQ